MKNIKLGFFVSALFFMAFVFWTASVCFIDVKEVGPQGTCVGFATFNQFIHRLIGTNRVLYELTDLLGLVPIVVCCVFGVIGIAQWIKRKSILKVDRDIIALGALYVVTIVFYIIFEYFAINYRPILINGVLEASYPSSTTLLVTSVMSTAVIQIQRRLNNSIFKIGIIVLISVFIVFMVVGRLISGVHWATDIIGGVLLSVSLVTLYATTCDMFK